jgi:hypothetical protein
LSALPLVISFFSLLALLLYLLGRGWFIGEGHGNAESDGQECG